MIVIGLISYLFRIFLLDSQQQYHYHHTKVSAMNQHEASIILGQLEVITGFSSFPVALPIGWSNGLDLSFR